MPHGGCDERLVVGPVPPGPEALLTFGKGPAAAFRRRLAAGLALRCRSSPDGAPPIGGALCFLSSQTRTRSRATQSRTRPAVGTPCRVMREPGQPQAFTCESPPVTSTGERPLPSGFALDRDRTRRRSLPLPNSRPFPANGARLREAMRAGREPTFRREPGCGMLQRQRTLDCRARVAPPLRRQEWRSTGAAAEARADPALPSRDDDSSQRQHVLPREPVARASPSDF